MYLLRGGAAAGGGTTLRAWNSGMPWLSGADETDTASLRDESPSSRPLPARDATP
jgi:hypothetical protein